MCVCVCVCVCVCACVHVCVCVCVCVKRILRAGGCPAVVAQWRNTGGSSQKCPGFDSRRLSPFSLSFFFCLITSKFIYFQREARCSEQIYNRITVCLEVWYAPSDNFPLNHQVTCRELLDIIKCPLVQIWESGTCYIHSLVGMSTCCNGRNVITQHTQIHKHMHAHTQTHTRMHTHIHMHACTYVLHKWYSMPQSHTWQPFSMCRQNSVRAVGCPAVVAQWQRCPGFNSRRLPAFLLSSIFAS